MNDFPLESFVFYRSFRDAIEEMNDEDKLSTLLAICDYALYGLEPNLKGPLPRAVFTVARPSIDANKVRRKNGKSGGRPSKKTNGFGNGNHRFSKSKSTETESESETESEAGAKKAGKPPRSRFTPPTLAEVQSYVAERHSPVDPQEFIDFYAAKGWMVGKTPMKDWKAACRNAEKWDRWSKAAEERPKRYDPSTGTWS